MQLSLFVSIVDKLDRSIKNILICSCVRPFSSRLIVAKQLKIEQYVQQFPNVVVFEAKSTT